jgi:threonine synthase
MMIRSNPSRRRLRHLSAFKAVTPLVQLDERHLVMELFHGRTLAFKDVAMQFLARAMDHVLAERDQRATIVGATSGDTGGAAIDAFLGRERTDMFILYPRWTCVRCPASTDDDQRRRQRACTRHRWHV